MSLQGVIEEMGLGEVIQALSLNRHRGTLRIETDEGISKFFFLSDGEIVLIRTVRSDPVRIGELLLRAGKVTREQLDSGLELQKQTGQRLGEALVALGSCTGADVDRVVRDKFEQEFLDIFLLDRGRFEFIFGLSPEVLFSPDEKLERIGLNTQGLMLEAMRRVDEWQTLLRDLTSLDEIYKTSADQRRSIEQDKFDGVPMGPELRREVYDAIDGQRSIREVLSFAQDHGASRHAAFLFLHAVRTKGLMEPLDVAECLEKAKDALDRNDAPATAKFLRSVMTKQRIEIGLVRRYIEFVKKSARPGFARSECRQLAANYLASGDTDHAIAVYREALAIEARDPEVLDRLFYAYLRKNALEDALQVGYRLRDYMNRENDLAIVARVVKNMRELAPGDWRVLEIGGLLLARQERRADARNELERALAAAKTARASEDEQARIVDALLEVDPERQALVRERELLRERASVRAAQDRARRRLVAVLIGFAILLFGGALRGEYLARADLGQGDDELTRATDTEGLLRALDYYRNASRRLSTVSGRADSKARELESKVRDEISALSSGGVAAIVQRQRREDEARAAREAEGREGAVSAALAEIGGARAAQDWDRAARLSLDLFARFGERDRRVAAITIPVRVRSTPPGALARVEGGTEGQTPCIVEAPPKRTSRLKVAKPGYAPAMTTVEATAFREVDVKLERGAAWRRVVGAPVVGSVAVGNGPSGPLVLARTRDGRVAALSASEGAIVWTTAPGVPEAADAAHEPSAPAIAQGRAVVSLVSGGVVGLDLVKGGEVFRLAGDRPGPGAPVTVELAGKERVAVARSTAVDILDASTGRVEASIALPAPLVEPLAAAGHTAVLLLAGEKVAIADLEKRSIVATVATKCEPVGPPAISTELGLAFVAGKDANVLALSLANGSVIYRKPTNFSSLLGAPAVDKEWLFLETPHGLAALAANEGRTLWDQPLGALAAPPRRIATLIYAPLKRGELVELATSDGARRTTTPLDGVPTGTPTLSNGALFLAAGTSVFSFERPEED
jgi:outer membrane protein assembly factor BamB